MKGACGTAGDENPLGARRDKSLNAIFCEREDLLLTLRAVGCVLTVGKIYHIGAGQKPTKLGKSRESPDTAVEYADHRAPSAMASDIIRFMASAGEIPAPTRSLG